MISSLTTVLNNFSRAIRRTLSPFTNNAAIPKSPWLLLPAVATALIILSTLATPAHAYQVQVSPASPVRGDTLSVVIQTEGRTAEGPTVTVNGTTYPSFPLSTNRYRALIPTSPNTSAGRMTLQVAGADGTNNVAVNIGNRNFPTQYITLSGASAGLEGTDHEFDRLDALRALHTPQKYWNGPMTKPSNGVVTSIYGLQRYYNGVFAEDYYHRGVDYAAGNGAPIYAPAAGRIEVVGRVQDGFVLNGNTIGIDHGQGVTSVMIHLSGFAVNEGDMVEEGQLIGYMGATGFASGPNLHWGLFVNGVSVDPVPWRYDGVE